MTELAAALEPWQSLFGNSAVISTTITAVHVLALLLGGGLAVAHDRATLRALRNAATDWEYQSRELDAVHTVVLVALATSIVSGLLMAAADIATYAAFWVFWVKLALVVLLMVNGWFIYHVRRHRAATARISLALWSLTAVLGVMLGNA